MAGERRGNYGVNPLEKLAMRVVAALGTVFLVVICPAVYNTWDQMQDDIAEVKMQNKWDARQDRQLVKQWERQVGIVGMINIERAKHGQHPFIFPEWLRTPTITREDLEDE